MLHYTVLYKIRKKCHIFGKSLNAKEQNHRIIIKHIDWSCPASQTHITYCTIFSILEHSVLYCSEYEYHHTMLLIIALRNVPNRANTSQYSNAFYVLAILEY